MFGILFLSMLGALISSDYPYVASSFYYTIMASAACLECLWLVVVPGTLESGTKAAHRLATLQPTGRLLHKTATLLPPYMEASLC